MSNEPSQEQDNPNIEPHAINGSGLEYNPGTNDLNGSNRPMTLALDGSDLESDSEQLDSEQPVAKPLIIEPRVLGTLSSTQSSSDIVNLPGAGIYDSYQSPPAVEPAYSQPPPVTGTNYRKISYRGYEPLSSAAATIARSHTIARSQWFLIVRSWRSGKSGPLAVYHRTRHPKTTSGGIGRHWYSRSGTWPWPYTT